MFKKALLFGLLTIMISVIVVFAYEDKFPRIAYQPPWKGGNLTYYPHFPQAVDTLHLTALIEMGGDPPFSSTDFSQADMHHLNLVNPLKFEYCTGQYALYQADRKNDPDYFQPDSNNQIRFLSTGSGQDNVGHGRQYPDLFASNGYAWFVSKDSANDNPGYVLYNLSNDPYGIDYTRQQNWADRIFHLIFRLKVPECANCLDTT
jgi:hypothetical protein